MSNTVEILDAAGYRRTLTRIAHESIERNEALESLCLVGILRRGAPIAEQLSALIENISGVRLPVGYLDITLYRDDLKEKADMPEVHGSNIPFSVQGKRVVMVDDVIFTGRTARAAMDALIDMGRPARISLAVMVDRGHRELPIRADYVGKNIPTSLDEIVQVRVKELDGEDRIVLLKKQG